MTARGPWRRDAACGDVCHWYDDCWLCEQCESGWCVDRDRQYLPPDVKRLPKGYVLPGVTKASSGAPVAPSCTYWTREAAGASLDCERPAVWGRVDPTGLRDYVEYACTGHVRWLATLDDDRVDADTGMPSFGHQGFYA